MFTLFKKNLQAAALTGITAGFSAASIKAVIPYVAPKFQDAAAFGLGVFPPVIAIPLLAAMQEENNPNQVALLLFTSMVAAGIHTYSAGKLINLNIDPYFAITLSSAVISGTSYCLAKLLDYIEPSATQNPVLRTHTA